MLPYITERLAAEHVRELDSPGRHRPPVERPASASTGPNPPPRRRGRIGAAWRAAHTPVAGVPSWARTAAYTVPFTVLPSSLWRIAAYTFHLPITRGGLGGPGTPSGIPGLPLELYTPLLSLASEILAFSAVGLIAAWGEQFPRWLPPLAGRRVPTPAAAVPAAAASLTLTLLWGWTAVSLALGRRIDGRLQTSTTPLSLTDWKGLLAVAAYAPLLMWGPLLASLTISYIQRRRDPNARGTPTPDHARRGQDRGEDRRGP